jgi:Flp pilus assembly protein TadD
LASGRKPGELGETSRTLRLEERPASKPVTGNRKWNRVLARCLDRDPARRFSSAEKVARALAPSHKLRWSLTAVAAAAIVVGIASQRRPIAPQETVRLAVLPFESEDRNLSGQLFEDATRTIARLESNERTRFTAVPAASAATHTLNGTLKRNRAKIELETYLTDIRSHVRTKEWTAEYAPEEIQFAGVALAGLITETLHLPPLVKQPEVNARAMRDYQDGIAFLRGDMTVDAALDSMTKAVAADSGSPLTHAGQALAQWMKYDDTNDRAWLDRATESARQAERRNPDLADVHRISGLLQAKAGAFERAIAEYRRAIEISPRDSDSYRRLGIAYGFNDRLSEALIALRKAIELEPTYFRNYQALGTFYLERSNYRDAIEQFRKAVQLAPAETGPPFALANAYINVGRYADAERELQTAIQLRETPDSLTTIGLVLMYQRREPEAIPFLLRASRLRPTWYLPWLDLGICYRRTHQSLKAEQANRRGLQTAEIEMTKNPRDGYVRAFLAYLCAGIGERARAESETAQALQLSPNDAATQWMAVLTYEALGRRDDALKIVGASSGEILADLNRWPDLADLQKDSRFKQLLTLHGIG